MMTKRGIGILSAAILAALSAAPSQADFVTYTASGIITQADNGSGLLPGALSSASIGSNVTVDFTIDTTAPGSSYAPGANLFQPAVVSVDASIGSGTVGIGVDSNYVAVANNTPGGDGNYYTEWLLNTSSNTAGLTGTASGFQLITAAGGPTPLNLYNDASLSNAPLQPGDANAGDELVLQFATFSNGTYQAQSDIVVGNGVSVTSLQAPEIDAGSAGSALTLLLGSLAVLCGRRGVKLRPIVG
ncbi:MAG: hypothetical protein ACYC9Z_13970 [Casimicrobiaceae bacterium]